MVFRFLMLLLLLFLKETPINHSTCIFSIFALNLSQAWEKHFTITLTRLKIIELA